MKIKRISTVFIFLMIILMFSGCGSQPVLNEAADNESITDEQWAEEIINESFDRLISEGIVVKSDSEDNDIFKYDEDGKLVFAGSSDESTYTASDFKTDAPVIWGRFDVPNPYKGEKAKVLEVYRKSSSEEYEKCPAYYPSSLPVSTKKSKSFAESRGTCQYLVVYAGLVANVEKDYYFGHISRTTRSTIVFVMDAVEKKVVHIEQVGVDIPENRTQNPSGLIKTEEAYQYMRDNCR